MSSEQVKYTIVSRLINGDPPRDIAAELDVSYSQVLKTKRDFEDAKLNNTIDQFVNMDEVMLNELVDAIQSKVPEELVARSRSALTNLQEAKTTLDTLKLDMETTALVLTSQIRTAALQFEGVGNLDTLATALIKLNDSFFNNKATQVNVQNNYGTESKYGTFLSDKPTNDF